MNDLLTRADARMVSYAAPLAGAPARSLHDKLLEGGISFKDRGAKGDGVTDDTAAVLEAVAYAQDNNVPVLVTSGRYLIRDQINVSGIGMKIYGDGNQDAVICTDVGMGSLLNFSGGGSFELEVEGVGFDTTGTVTRCVSHSANVMFLRGCAFRGTMSGALIRSTGHIMHIEGGRFDVDAPGTIGVEYDGYNQNCTITPGTRFGGVGCGVRVIHSNPAHPRVEGLSIIGAIFINTGPYNISVGDSMRTLIEGCILDQASSYALEIADGATMCTLKGSWAGLSTTGGAGGTCIVIRPGAGPGNRIVHNDLYGGVSGIAVEATAANRVSKLLIQGNTFDSHSRETLSLDSVANCRILDNSDLGARSSCNWYTKGTAGAGSYWFSDNSWSGPVPPLFDAASGYRWGYEDGVVGRNRGSAQPVSAATSIVISHGLFRVPTHVTAVLEGVNQKCWVTTRTSTTLTIAWETSAQPIVHWSAEV
ncbi:hypothetical protein [Azospirillum argentinense]|uniref:glycosyl hydrolase family 28-related protein n=1 Tax=Azospirillum argentinense TaxID=2970906 RepID=UPI0032DEA53E